MADVVTVSHVRHVRYTQLPLERRAREVLRRFIPERARRAVVRTRRLWAPPDPFARVEDLSFHMGSVGGEALRQRYPGATVGSSTALHRAECSIFSQNGEDGVLAWIFDGIGPGLGRCIEFGCGNGRENCTANLIVNFGWSGELLDADPANVASAGDFFARVLGPERTRASIRRVHITASNVDGVVAAASGGADPDLLSIDIDGVDYWVWEAVTSVRPRVVVIEYNASCGPTRAITVPYRADFELMRAHPSRLYHGASIAALSRLGQRKGYRLIGCESRGVNAFFIRDDIAGPQGVTPELAWRPHAERSMASTDEEQWAVLSGLGWVRV